MAEDLGRLLADAIAQLETRLSTKLEDGFEQVDKNMKKMRKKMGQMEKKMEGIKERMETMEWKMERMEEKQEEMDERIMKHLVKIGKKTGHKISEKEDSAWSGDDEEEENRSESSGSTVRARRARRYRSWSEERGWSSGHFTDSDEESTMTAKEPGVRPDKFHNIFWRESDEIVKRMQAERMSNGEEIPSFWNYDPRCLPKEFVGLEKKTFLDDPPTVNISFLNKDILRKISKMLDPMDFLNLSYTCRYLHWRLFTFCTCHVPYPVHMDIRDQTMGYYEKCEKNRLFETAPNKKVYTIALEENDRRSPYLAKEEGLRAVVARIPSCLRKPFIFEYLGVSITSPFFTKDNFDRCLDFILPLRNYVRNLAVYMYYYNRAGIEKFFEYQAANAFLQTLHVTSYNAHDKMYFGSAPNRNLMIFENCPYARLMDSVELRLRDTGSKYEDAVFLNRTGTYSDPPVSAIIRTIEEFCYGTAILDYHQYDFQDDEKQIAFMEYFYANCGNFEEYYKEDEATVFGGRYRVSTRVKRSKIVRFATIITKETGRKHMMRVTVEPFIDDLTTHVTFGTEKAFAEKREFSFYPSLETCRTGKDWWRMETAIEPEEGNEDKKESAAGDEAN